MSAVDVRRNTPPAHVDQVVLTSAIVVEHPARRVEREAVELERDLLLRPREVEVPTAAPDVEAEVAHRLREPGVAEHAEHPCFPDTPRLPVLRISVLEQREHDSAPAPTRGTQVDGARRKLVGPNEAA